MTERATLAPIQTSCPSCAALILRPHLSDRSHRSSAAINRYYRGDTAVDVVYLCSGVSSTLNDYDSAHHLTNNLQTQRLRSATPYTVRCAENSVHLRRSVRMGQYSCKKKQKHDTVTLKKQVQEGNVPGQTGLDCVRRMGPSTSLQHGVFTLDGTQCLSRTWTFGVRRNS